MALLAPTYALAALTAGSTVYCLLVVIAAFRHRSEPSPAQSTEPISILKPLSGLDPGLESNLRTFFNQTYAGRYEILFAVRHATDPAATIVEKLRAEYPAIPSRLLLTGDAPYANRKVWALENMLAEARHDLLAMSDSDIRVDAHFLATVASEFAGTALQVTTCPYRAVAGNAGEATLWSRLEAIGLNTEFISGILVAKMLEGMRFAVGPTIIARKTAIETLGGWRAFREYLAEDFVLGQRAADAGMQVGLSSYVIEHHIGSQAFAANMGHRLRWVRSTRRSRPAGYAGELFTKTLPLTCILTLAAPNWWPLAAIALITRYTAAIASARTVRAPLTFLNLLTTLPVQDMLSFAFWFLGFFGNTIAWRGQRYYLHPDGRFEVIS